MRLRVIGRQGGYGFLFVALGCLALAACGGGGIGASSRTPSPYSPPSPSSPSPAASRPVIGPVAVTATPSPSTSTATLACSVHTAEGSEDDETQQTLTCTVKQAPSTDSHFTLHYGVRDPAGNLHPFPQTCDGALRKGTGSCSQTYEFVFAFSPTPAPITGESLPSHKTLGPATPAI
jgi:hypothetical protein